MQKRLGILVAIAIAAGTSSIAVSQATSDSGVTNQRRSDVPWDYLGFLGLAGLLGLRKRDHDGMLHDR